MRADEPRWRRTLRVAALVVAILALVTWPLACRYTSLGFDFETADGDRVQQTFWRLRWPGDGSVAVAWIAEHRCDGGEVQPWDLGGAFLEPAPELAPEGFCQRHGFWWLDFEARGGPAPPVVAGADRAVLVGVPHGLLVAVAAAFAGWLHRRCGRA